MYGVAGDYQKTANDEILVIPMIETCQAVKNIDEILDDDIEPVDWASGIRPRRLRRRAPPPWRPAGDRGNGRRPRKTPARADYHAG
jgi:hypothetical protein